MGDHALAWEIEVDMAFPTIPTIQLAFADEASTLEVGKPGQVMGVAVGPQVGDLVTADWAHLYTVGGLFLTVGGLDDFWNVLCLSLPD